MEELYLEVFSPVSSNGTCDVPLETVIAIFIFEYCKEPPLNVSLIQSSDVNNRAKFKIRLPELIFDFRNEYDIDVPGNLCKLPVMITPIPPIIVYTGLCSVMRHFIRLINNDHLLGFKQGCLRACSGVSLWTKFCEVDMIKTVNDMFDKDDWCGEIVPLPADITRLENHLSKPAKVHNAMKEALDIAQREQFLQNNETKRIKIEDVKELEHTFIEGHRMSLLDLILFPSVYLIFQFYGLAQVKNVASYTFKWYENIMKDDRVATSILFARGTQKLPVGIAYTLTYVPCESFYRKERGKSRKQIFPNQFVIHNIFEVLVSIQKYMPISERPFGHDETFDWSYVPLQLQLSGMGFPKARLERKAQQLINVIKAVLKIAKEGDRIVEFCAGSGYLGLILAHVLPSCTIVLVENKEESLNRAKERVISCKLPNVIFCQGNIDYFVGCFNIGVSLHACGVSTDLVIEKCLTAKASFICCPCCYGSIDTNHMIRYPRSKIFKDSQLTLVDYYSVARAADQENEEYRAIFSGGKKCMNIIDSDRCLRAREYCYDVHLSTMEPPECTPKNNLLVGIPK